MQRPDHPRRSVGRTGRAAGPNEDGKNNLRLVKSRSGHVIRLDDTRDAEKIEVIDKSGKNSLIFDTATNMIKIKAARTSRSRLRTGRSGWAQARHREGLPPVLPRLTAGSSVDVEVSGTVNLKGGTIDLN